MNKQQSNVQSTRLSKLEEILKQVGKLIEEGEKIINAEKRLLNDKKVNTTTRKNKDEHELKLTGYAGIDELLIETHKLFKESNKLKEEMEELLKYKPWNPFGKK